MMRARSVLSLGATLLLFAEGLSSLVVLAQETHAEKVARAQIGVAGLISEVYVKAGIPCKATARGFEPPNELTIKCQTMGRSIASGLAKDLSDEANIQILNVAEFKLVKFSGEKYLWGESEPSKYAVTKKGLVRIKQ